MSFAHRFIASFLNCSSSSYRSSNYRDSYCCRSFLILEAIANSKGKLIANAFKGKKERKLWKRDIYRKRNKEKKQKSIPKMKQRAIT